MKNGNFKHSLSRTLFDTQLNVTNIVHFQGFLRGKIQLGSFSRTLIGTQEKCDIQRTFFRFQLRVKMFKFNQHAADKRPTFF